MICFPGRARRAAQAGDCPSSPNGILSGGLATTRRVLVAGVAGVVLLGTPSQAGAASWPVSGPRVVARLDFSRGQTPENVALEPDGSADVALAVAAQIARVSRSGGVRVLAQFPRPAGGAACPVLGHCSGRPRLPSA